MAPSTSRWTADKTEALLNAFGKTLLKTATAEQKDSIPEHMKLAGFECSWEAIRYVFSLFVFLRLYETLEHDCAAAAATHV